jgi:hypothetical protein
MTAGKPCETSALEICDKGGLNTFETLSKEITNATHRQIMPITFSVYHQRIKCQYVISLSVGNTNNGISHVCSVRCTGARLLM